MSELRIFPYHLARAGICLNGTRRFAAMHGLDFRGFVRDGFLVSEAEKIDDANVRRLVALVKKESAGG